MKQERERKPTFDPEYIRDVSEAAYRARLDSDCAGNVARMLDKDRDGVRLRNRAGSYDVITRAYLKALGFEPNSAPEVSASHNSGERLPQGDQASAGAETLSVSDADKNGVA